MLGLIPVRLLGPAKIDARLRSEGELVGVTRAVARQLVAAGAVEEDDELRERLAAEGDDEEGEPVAQDAFQSLTAERDAAVLRAEAAERRVAELEAERGELARVIDGLTHELETLRAERENTQGRRALDSSALPPPTADGSEETEGTAGDHPSPATPTKGRRAAPTEG